MIARQASYASNIKRNASRAALYVALAVAAVLFLFPFYWLAVSAFKSQGEIFSVPPRWTPWPLRTENVVMAFRETNIARAFFNSTVIAVSHVAVTLFLCSLAGYAFAKFPRAPGSRQLFAFVLGTMMIPSAVTLIPNFVVFANLRLIDTYWAMIIPGAASAFGIFWMRQYLGSNLPNDLIHAARIDGCSEFGIYWRIALPVARPALAALGIMTSIGAWNNLMWAFVALRTKEMQTLPVVIYLLQGETRTPYGMLMACGLIATLPLVIAFLLFQKHFVQGITSGAIKA
jgi:ABC-type glycerol-3-phosphate transport system permease component